MPPRLAFWVPISKDVYAEHNGFNKPLGENHNEALKMFAIRSGASCHP